MILPGLLLLGAAALAQAESNGYCPPSQATCKIIGDPWVYTFQSTMYEFSKPGTFYAVESDEFNVQVEVVTGKSVSGHVVHVVNKVTYVCDPENAFGKYTKKSVTPKSIGDEDVTFTCKGVGSCRSSGDCSVSVVKAYDPIESLAITAIRYTGSHSYGGLCYDNDKGCKKKTKTTTTTTTTKKPTTTTTTTTTTTKPKTTTTTTTTTAAKTTTTTTTTTTSKPTTTTTTTTTTAKPTTTTTTTTTTTKQATTKAAETTAGTTAAVTTTTKYSPGGVTPGTTTAAEVTTTKYAPAAETTTTAAVTTTSKYAPAGNTPEASTTGKYAPAGNVPETATTGSNAAAASYAAAAPAAAKPNNLYNSSAAQVLTTVSLALSVGFFMF